MRGGEHAHSPTTALSPYIGATCPRARVRRLLLTRTDAAGGGGAYGWRWMGDGVNMGGSTRSNPNKPGAPILLTRTCLSLSFQV